MTFENDTTIDIRFNLTKALGQVLPQIRECIQVQYINKLVDDCPQHKNSSIVPSIHIHAKFF